METGRLIVQDELEERNFVRNEQIKSYLFTSASPFT